MAFSSTERSLASPVVDVEEGSEAEDTGRWRVGRGSLSWQECAGGREMIDVANPEVITMSYLNPCDDQELRLGWGILCELCKSERVARAECSIIFEKIFVASCGFHLRSGVLGSINAHISPTF